MFGVLHLGDLLLHNKFNHMKIQKLKVNNFKKFKGEHTVVFNDDYNILIGDNETGKSTILLALDLTLSGNRNKVESIGLESLFNIDVIEEFLANENKTFDSSPSLIVEAYLDENKDHKLNGKQNSEHISCDGLKLVIEPDFEQRSIIDEIIKSGDNIAFPFEYYKISFTTFADEAYSTYNRPVKYVLVNESNMSNAYMMKEYTKDIFDLIVNDKTKLNLEYKYRKHRKNFDDTLRTINDDLANLKIGVANKNSQDLFNNIAVFKDNIQLSQRGMGLQSKIKIESAIEKYGDKGLNVILIEEPENHLSTHNLKEMIDNICEDNGESQIIITTHNSMITSRLGLNKIIALSESSAIINKLSSISEETARFFKKNATNNILEFLLSNKIILVEGAAEYILLEKFYEIENGNKPSLDGVFIISVNGLSFLRYLEVAKLLNKKTVVITDNDGDYKRNVDDKYSSFKEELIKVYSDTDNNNNTFETCLFNSNKEWFKNNNITKSNDTEKFMLNNKAENALRILEVLDNNGKDKFEIPRYIKDALKWIKN